MIFNNKAQQGTILTLIFLVGTALFVFFMFGAEQIAYWGHQGVIQNNLTGLEAFFMENLNAVVVLGVALFTLIGGFYVSGGGS